MREYEAILKTVEMFNDEKTIKDILNSERPHKELLRAIGDNEVRNTLKSSFDARRTVLILLKKKLEEGCT